ncbi:MAG: dihydroxy-acid dehydratase [Firmicutes bacterium]|nr:dihydroxy-acid dehydratase [Bacillota bacterium]
MQSEILKPDYAIAKHRLLSLGLCQDDLVKPLVLILYEDGCYDSLTDVKIGITMAGGCAVQFALPSLNDMAAMGNGKNLLLSNRESVADLTESLLSMYDADSVLLIARSEMTAAGMLIGAVRKNTPLVFLPSKGAGFSHAKAHLTKAMVSCGKASLSEMDFLENVSTVRSKEMDNFNSLALFCEGAGISVFGSFAPMTASDRIMIARESGKRAAFRAEKMNYPRKDFSIKSFMTGLSAFLAASGTLASLLHIICIARENGFKDVDFDYVASLSEKIPILVKMSPLGEHDIFKFQYAGGVRGLIKELINVPKLLDMNIRYAESTLAEVVEDLKVDSDIIVGVSNHFAMSGISCLKGNAFDAALFRRALGDGAGGVFNAVTSDKTKLKAHVYDSEDLAKGAILSGSIGDGSLIIIKGQAAKTNGMPLLDIESLILAKELKDVMVITDGRCLEFMQIPFICMADKTDVFDVCQTGDMVEIDFKKDKVSIDISSKEVANRIKKNISDNMLTGSLNKYTRLVGLHSAGAGLKQKF